jgi:hypothetical protein
VVSFLAVARDVSILHSVQIGPPSLSSNGYRRASSSDLHVELTTGSGGSPREHSAFRDVCQYKGGSRGYFSGTI